MKLWKSFLTGAAVAVALAAAPLAASAQDTTRIALVVKGLGIGFFEAANKGAQEAAKELGDVEVIYTGPTDTTAEGQSEVINALIAQRVESPFVLAAHPVRPGRQTSLYGVMPLLDGETLESRLSRDPMSVEKALGIAIHATRGLAALHRLDVIHRDIKPENIMLLVDGGLKLIDLGVARLPRIEDFHADEIPGTPGYLAPEQFSGAPGDAKSDIFALGVVLYRLFAGAWPYGEQELYQRPRFTRARPPSNHRRDIPGWLDDAILTAIDPDRNARFDDAVGLLRRLEGGGPIRSGPPRFVPLAERDPVRFWQLVSGALGAALIASLLLR